MVNVVDNSTHFAYSNSYKEINQQLAKDNGDLRQQLNVACSEIARLRLELHKKDVDMIELNRQLKELRGVKAKYIAVRDIILESGPIESIHHLEASVRAIEQAQNDLEDDDDDDDDGDDGDGDQSQEQPNEPTLGVTTSLRHSPEHPKSKSCPSYLSSEASSTSSSSPSSASSSSSLSYKLSKAEEEIVAEEMAQPTSEASNAEEMEAQNLDRISERSEEESAHSPCPSSNQTNRAINDSLEPHEVTSVPPLQPERTMHTPSIWNFLDPLDTSRRSNHQQAECMFQSTPVQRQRDSLTGISPNAEVDNQENVQTFAQASDSPPGPKKLRVSNDKPKGKRQKPVCREVTFGEQKTCPEPRTRYNLRKRTKL